MTRQELIKKHNLQGRWIGSQTREYTPVETPELVEDLLESSNYFQKDTCNNPEHEDYGKPILIFTFFFSDPVDADAADKLI